MANSPGDTEGPEPAPATDQATEAFRLVRTDGNRFQAGSIGDPSTRDVVYGGQLLAQMILASDQVAEDKDVASIHAIFARAACA